MSKIRSRDTSPELKHRERFRKLEYQPKSLFGNPDFIDWKNKTVFFIDGCFWHKCPIHWNKPKSNKEYWLIKLEKNAIRDKEIDIAYKNVKWKVVRIWEHELRRKS